MAQEEYESRSKGQKVIGKAVEFVKRETVLFVAALLAVLSMFIVPPDAGYTDYIDMRTLAILFSLMTVMEGLKQLGIFDKIARVILKSADGLKKLAFIMVFLCFFSSMLITNDVALITFVPLTLLLLSLAGLTDRAVPVVVLETVAANLGSMLTPVGNPQNLYLYTASGMALPDFLRITAPITALSAVLLGVGCLTIPAIPVRFSEGLQGERKSIGRKQLVFFGVLFLLSLLAVQRLLPVWIPCLIAVAGTFLVQRDVLKRVDYGLLLTFVCFFVFIGNMGRVESVSGWLCRMMVGREMFLSFLTSQVISNVPAALLLSGFTENYAALIRGTNIGGLGTLIASLASLISYKAFVKENPQKKGKYILYFTLVNLLFALILLGFVSLIV